MHNLFLAWKEFRKGKSKKKDVQQFEYRLKKNILELHQELKNKNYKHSEYFSFYVKDPKLRHIHKACVRDRVLHHAIFRVLYPIFDKSFIFDSYSCRIKKGTHRAVKRLDDFARKAGRNDTRTCFTLKCDIKNFFDSIDQTILISLIKDKVKDKNTIWLIERVIRSFGKGLPLGNITSQLFANIYLNKLDQFIKRVLKIKYYIRYCDDFIILSDDIRLLENLVFEIEFFLKEELKLCLHPGKVIIKEYHNGIDFLGYVNFPFHRILRQKTKKRMLKRIEKKRKELSLNIISEDSFYKMFQSYFGVLKHCDSFKIKRKIS